MTEINHYDDPAEAYKEFKRVVNMTPAKIETWLKTEDSKSVGWSADGEGEAVGHKSGKKIVTLKRKKKSELTKADYKHMQKVISYVHRHLKQGPKHKKDVETSRWRYSLMNWGHDPLKK